MQSVWKIAGHNSLLLFFTGWGMDNRATDSLSTERYDICTCFDYTDLTTSETERWKEYSEIVVVGWSMGVWAAERVLQGRGLKITKSIAINGTSTPVDDNFGIPVSIAKGTCEGLTENSFRKFIRRVGGNFEHREDIVALKIELERIIDSLPTADFHWDKAIVSRNDAIFPPDNMLRFWQERCTVEELDAPHYPFEIFKSWEELL